MCSRIKVILSLLSFLFLFTASGIAQKLENGFNRELSFRHDNDAFAFRGTDGYYTSGLFIDYSYVRTKKKEGVIKVVDNIEVGQKILTPRIRQVFVITELDRPITGYLFLEFSRTEFKTRNRFFKYGLSTGAVGPLSLAKQLLDVVHPLLQIEAQTWSWMFNYGIKNEVGINAHASYGFSIFSKNYAGFLQATPVSSVTLGTSFTSITQSFLIQLGRQNAMYESAIWNSRLQSNRTVAPENKWELFAYYQPEVMYQIYNATVQGGIFRSDKGRILAKNEPFVLVNKFGATYACSRVSLGLHITFQSKEAKSQETSHVFGGVSFSYRYR